ADVANGKNPRDVKILLAKEIIARFHDQAAADAAEQEFINRFQKGAMPDEMPEFTFEGEIGLANLLKQAGLVPSTSEAIRAAQQGGVKINGESVDNVKQTIQAGTTAVYQVGKRKFARVSIK
ncbi:S4 domain-containing protein, partial [Lonepinella koalarum]